jgi:exonuclease V gamma subunit
VPPGPAGRAAARATLDALSPALAAWRHDPVTQVRDIALDLGDGCVLRGTLAGVHRDGLRQFSASRAHGKALLALGIDALAWSALGEPLPIDRIVGGERTTLAPLDAAVARAKLRALVDLAQRARDEVLAFAPKTGLELVRHAQDASARPVRDAWFGDEATGRPGEGDDPWIRVALRGAMPLDEAEATARMAALASDVFEGLPGVASVPGADAEDAA